MEIDTEFSPMDWELYSLEDWLSDQDEVNKEVENSEKLQEMVAEDEKEVEESGKNFNFDDEIDAAEDMTINAKYAAQTAE